MVLKFVFNFRKSGETSLDQTERSVAKDKDDSIQLTKIKQDFQSVKVIKVNFFIYLNFRQIQLREVS